MSERHTICPCNDIGLTLNGTEGEFLKTFRVFEEAGSVQIWAVIQRSNDAESHEALQYLNPHEAMQFAKAFKRCAIAALKNSAP